MKNILKIGVALAALLCAVGAWAEQPLVQDGKKSVFQRLVTHPGAALYSGPEAGAAKVKDLPTFSMMYIYGDEGDRFRVGSSTVKSDGWIDKKLATEWPQAITMVFTDRTGRDPVLFFRDHKALEDTCLLDDVSGAVAKYQKQLATNEVPAKFPVIASEPMDKAVAQKNFYLLPVLSIDDQFYENQGPRLIEVASINPGTGDDKNSQAASSPKGKDSDFRTGFVFVIDTTISMKPYIDQTVELIRNLYDELEKNPNADKMAFAVVAFRSNTDRSP
ncbi:MAG: VWA domain-containing protein, partial [Desulfovibrio sp.]|nr:VWA domain-containing protein [Desulfovibrio sp.]